MDIQFNSRSERFIDEGEPAKETKRHAARISRAFRALGANKLTIGMGAYEDSSDAFVILPHPDAPKGTEILARWLDVYTVGWPGVSITTNRPANSS